MSAPAQITWDDKPQAVAAPEIKWDDAAQPAAYDPNTASTWEKVKHGATELGAQLNPVTAIQGMAQLAAHPDRHARRGQRRAHEDLRQGGGRLQSR
jgi:hypothetical protein